MGLVANVPSDPPCQSSVKWQSVIAKSLWIDALRPLPSEKVPHKRLGRARRDGGEVSVEGFVDCPRAPSVEHARGDIGLSAHRGRIAQPRGDLPHHTADGALQSALARLGIPGRSREQYQCTKRGAPG